LITRPQQKYQRKKEAKQLRWRLFAFILLHTLIGLHLYLWYVADWKVIGAIDMQELFRHFLENNALTAGALFFLVAIGLGLLWGRYFCGWLCHIGQAYDLLAALYKKLGIPMRIYALRWGAVMAAIILGYYFVREAVIHRITNPTPPMTVAMGLTTPWELLPGWVMGTLTLGLVLLILPIFFGPRVFCKHLCPWGVALGWTNHFSRLKVRRTGDCTMCGACSTACPMDLDVSRLINQDFHVNKVRCTNCLQCVASCPTDALKFTLAKHENREPQKRPLLAPLAYVPVWEEVSFWALCFFFGWVYGGFYGVGIFFAFSLGLLLAWLTIHAVKLVKKKRVLAVLALLLLTPAWVVTAKDGLAHYHYSKGRRAFIDKDFNSAQHHYEKSDSLMWVAPNNLLYHLYIIYKSTGQEAKRKALYDRYEQRRKAQKKDTVADGSGQ